MSRSTRPSGYTVSSVAASSARLHQRCSSTERCSRSVQPVSSSSKRSTRTQKNCSVWSKCVSSKRNTMRRSNSGAPTSSTARPVSSCSSRRAASSSDSSGSTPPPGVNHQSPSFGPRRIEAAEAGGTQPSGSITRSRAETRGVGVTPARRATVSHVASTAATIAGSRRAARPCPTPPTAASTSAPPRANSAGEVGELGGEPPGRIALDLVGPQPIGRLDPVEVRMEVRAAEIPGRRGRLVEQVGTEHGFVDHDALRRGVRPRCASSASRRTSTRGAPLRRIAPARATGTRAPRPCRTPTPGAWDRR